MEKYILSLDQGTTSSRAVLINEKAQIVSMSQKEIRQIYPKEGWVEHDPIEILNSVIEVTQEVIEKLKIQPQQIKSIGITNQRETTVVWNKETGIPIHNAIVWQDNRTIALCEKLKKQKLEKTISDKTGLVIGPYFSATKIKWLLDNDLNVKKQAKSGKLIFGNIDTWLVWNLTNKSTHATDFSNASRTMLFNINTLKWDEDILEELDIPKTILPDVKDSNSYYGDFTYKGTKIPINGILGDQQASLFGHMCFEKNSIKNTYGTGCFMLMNTGNKIIKSNNGLLSTIAWRIENNISYSLEGSIFIGGAAIQWLRDELGIIKTSDQSEKEALKSTESKNLYMVPAFNGLGAPYWDMYATGLIIGITRDTNNSDIIKATLDSIAYQTKDVLISMENDAGSKIKTLNVDGGASNNNYLMQFQSDILGINIKRPKNTEITALGAGYIAGLKASFWDMDHLKTLNTNNTLFHHSYNKNQIDDLYNKWKKAIHRSMNWN